MNDTLVALDALISNEVLMYQICQLTQSDSHLSRAKDTSELSCVQKLHDEPRVQCLPTEHLLSSGNQQPGLNNHVTAPNPAFPSNLGQTSISQSPYLTIGETPTVLD